MKSRTLLNSPVSDSDPQAVPCFGDSLVQANLANIRELKNGISEMNTERIANFSMILTYAFELLEEFRVERRGACCNQAIMIITDGVPDNYKEIFQRYNWASNPDNPDMADMPVRIFTYLIGREVADVRDSRWMACANRGYFVHLSTLAEVREQVSWPPVLSAFICRFRNYLYCFDRIDTIIKFNLSIVNL